MQSVMAHQFEMRPRSYYDRLNESHDTVSNSDSLQVLSDPTVEQSEAPPSDRQSTTVAGDGKNEYLVLKAEISLQYIGSLLELFETHLKQLEAEKEHSGKNEGNSKDVESCASSAEVSGIIGNSARLDHNGYHAETGDDSLSTKETEAERDLIQEIDWSFIDKEMESLTDSFEAEQDNFNEEEEVGISCGDEQPKPWVNNSLEDPQDHSSHEVDWSFDENHLNSESDSSDTLRENSNEESKRTFGDVDSSSGLFGGLLFDEYINNLCKSFECSIEKKNAWKTTAGNDWLSAGNWKAFVKSDHSPGAEKVDSPSVRIYTTVSGPGGELVPAADSSSKSHCYQSPVLPTQITPSTPNPVEVRQSPVSAKLEGCVPLGVFEALSSVADEFYNPVRAAGPTYGPIGTPPLSRIRAG